MGGRKDGRRRDGWMQDAGPGLGSGEGDAAKVEVEVEGMCGML
jgi:hypothetical protein